MKIGDTVVRKSYNKDITFKIIDVKDVNDKIIYVLKGVNLRIVADADGEDLEEVKEDSFGRAEILFDKKVNDSIRSIINERDNKDVKKKHKSSKQIKITPINNNKSMTFRRPGKILHIDGDAAYLEVCLKVYKQLSIDAVGRVITESEQPDKILSLVKEVKPDIVVATGHDGISKDIEDYIDLNNYRNSKYFVEAVCRLREYEPNYDNLVIYAGACQSCYEAILDAGANYASSPERVLIHCLDPVFVCQKVAYTSINEIVNIQDVVKNTITGYKGIGGLQTRGKCREGYPKSAFIR
ncbi:spore coat assemly protein [Clostridium acidisoli DSM 12555]|uniref:Spore coat assemly protein n=1 Tax=Clostridium acidisoli DSM 12555 TaxID=1121291 RepID=A0A1W1XY16_9CLOT|nr:sporulation peptidase YabG [Clostridium acidisoli]SMC28823.1 spore coat assemly protein [Clostridium acidisoli DSM 12555]